ncbi:hypothetical protein PENTCL1PPCAC_9988 [Pristionchus entomophagus]|uniref:BACK domain-containing protein n=1 Tax=Pristionchus entomophagus TaxID=358040 RepID=A0AAV5SXG8_9BILA|nr:hypothetical protein PENTCL1PPCAC_9988 [Pristionchus entomophagus]
MASAAVNSNPLKDSSNKLSSSHSDKKAKTGAKTAAKPSKNPGSSSGRGSGSSKSSRSGKKGGSGKTRTKESGGGSKSKGSRADTIKLSCGSDVYYVNARHFAACSNLIKKELAVNAHARSVDLRAFDKTTVRVLAEYIESKRIKTDCSFYSLAELLKLSKVFEMENLRSQLEKFITVIAGNDLATLHQVLLIIGITSVTRPTERMILERAARNFAELAAQNTFQRIPFNVVISLFARCDLNVKNEVQVVDAMLLWLAGQPNLPTVVPSLFYLIRHDFIHPIQKAFIVERARALRFPEDVINIIERCFECRNGARICVLKEHYEAKFARCGIADASHLDAKNPDMPLSIPREAILYKPAEAETAAAAAAGNRSFHSSEARPYYHAPPACSGRSVTVVGWKRSQGKKPRGKSSKGASKKGKASNTQQSSSSKRSKSASGSRKSSRSKKETKPKTPSKGKK